MNFSENVYKILTPTPPLPKKAYELLLALYSSNDRFYHNGNHINHCLNELFVFANNGCVVAHDELSLAILFHDAIYNTHDNNNEINSAHLCSSVMGCNHRVFDLICITDHKDKGGGEKRFNTDQQIMLDIDLSSLAADYDTFVEDGENIRKEYFWVPDEIFNVNRASFMKSLLERDKIYHSELGIGLYETKARENITKLLDQMAQPERK